MSILTDNFLVNYMIKPIWNGLDEKKTVIGATSLLLWVAIYAMPAFGPKYNFITSAGTTIRDALIANGVQLDNTAFNTGAIFTIMGLADKMRKMIKK